jgi:hypothetical protein
MRPAAARAALDVDREAALEQLRPRAIARASSLGSRARLDVVGRCRGRLGHDARAQLARRRHDPCVTNGMQTRRGHRCGQPTEQRKRVHVDRDRPVGGRPESQPCLDCRINVVGAGSPCPGLACRPQRRYNCVIDMIRPRTLLVLADSFQQAFSPITNVDGSIGCVTHWDWLHDFFFAREYPQRNGPTSLPSRDHAVPVPRSRSSVSSNSSTLWRYAQRPHSRKHLEWPHLRCSSDNSSL